MKKKIMAGILSAVLAVGTASVIAAEKQNVTPSPVVKQAAQKVFLYQAADKQSAHTQISLQRWHTAKPFYEKGDWVKVGFSDSGKTGWVNKKQLEHAWMANQEQHSTIQTVFVSHQIGKDGKPVTNVVAYRNGHKISDQQAKKMYENMRVSQLHQEREFARMNRHFQQVMNRDFQSFDDPFFTNAPQPVGYDAWPQW